MTTIELFDGTGSAPLPPGFDVAGFTDYLNSVWQQRPLLLQADEGEDERRSTQQRFFQLSGGRISARNYTGFVQFADCRIQVYPRVFEGRSGFQPAWAVEHVIRWLSYSNRLHFPYAEIPAGLLDADDWLEAFIFLFAYFTLPVVSNTPHYAYEEVTEEMAFMRGQLAMNEYVRNNLATGKHHLMHCRYEPFVYDNLFNRIIKHVSRRLLSFTEKPRNAALLRDILFVLDEVSDAPCTAFDCDRVQLNRLFPEKDQALQLCRWFLQMLYTNGANATAQESLCLLLPMEVIFEEYVAGFISQHFPALKARIQASDEFLAKDARGTSVFQMKHDILIPNQLIIDTKYKFRQVEDAKQGVSQHDMYQMVSYCYRRNIDRGMLLYPAGSKPLADAAFRILDKTIFIKSIDIVEIELNDFENLQRTKMAMFL